MSNSDFYNAPSYTNSILDQLGIDQNTTTHTFNPLNQPI